MSYFKRNKEVSERTEKLTLTPGQWAVLKHVWKLEEAYKPLVMQHGIFKILSKEFQEKVDQTHAYMDFITTRGRRKYEVTYLDTNLEHMENFPYLLISLRTTKSGVGLALVRVASPEFQLNSYPTLSW